MKYTVKVTYEKGATKGEWSREFDNEHQAKDYAEMIREVSTMAQGADVIECEITSDDTEEW